MDYLIFELLKDLFVNLQSKVGLVVCFFWGVGGGGVGLMSIKMNGWTQ